MNEDIKNNIQVALSLKLQHLTYPEISQKIGRPLGTIKRWLAPYSAQWQDERSEIARKNALSASLKNQEKCEKLRAEVYNEARQNAEEDLNNKFLRDFVNLYIGEGSKTNKGDVTITNSDPKVIFISIRIIKKYFLKENKKISFIIKHYEANNNEQELLNYWKNLLKNEGNIVFKTYLQLRKNNLTHNNSNKFGLVIIRVCDTDAKQRLNAYMDHIKEEWITEFETTFNTKIDMNVKQVVALKKQ